MSGPAQQSWLPALSILLFSVGRFASIVGMCIRAATAIVVLLGFVPFSARLAHGEYIPPPTLLQLANASIIVQGHYKLVKGQPQFIAERVLAGKNSLQLESPGSDLRVNETGDPAITSEVVWNWPFRFGITRIDATRSRLWLVGVKSFLPARRPPIPIVEPVELADGYLALRMGEQPSLLFHVLQKRDRPRPRNASRSSNRRSYRY